MRAPKILLFGKGGQVATELAPVLPLLGPVTVCGIDDCPFEDRGRLIDRINTLRPDIIVNGAAYTAVDRAETEAEAAYLVNATAVSTLAESARDLGALLVHYSTDYVFDGLGTTPYLESDVPHPRSVYGQSKREGEVFLEGSGASYLLFRTAWVYAACGSNFMKTMLRLGAERSEISVVDDQVGSPTPAKVIAFATALALQSWWAAPDSQRQALLGTYHLVTSGQCSWNAFAQAIFKTAQELYAAGLTDHRLTVQSVKAIPTSAYPTPAARPAWSVLNNNKFQEAFRLRLPAWDEALPQIVAEYLRLR
jgi:dTDP-4-dehydrorhamnose reductase